MAGDVRLRDMDSLLDFRDKVTLITGAAQGFGALLAHELGGRGARLVLGDINSDAVRSVAAAINENGGEALAMRCDVSSEADCKALVDLAVERFGRLDIAVNNAGIAGTLKHLDELEETDMDRHFAVNAKSVQFGMKYQVRQMKRQDGGSILNVASMAGIGAAPKAASYAASKHAVIGLTKTAAFEFARQNIRVNAICPFYSSTAMVTDMARDSGIDDANAFLGRGTPMRRIAAPEEIVNAMVLLLSPGNTFMSGQAIAVDGGSSAI